MSHLKHVQPYGTNQRSYEAVFMSPPASFIKNARANSDIAKPTLQALAQIDGLTVGALFVRQIRDNFFELVIRFYTVRPLKQSLSSIELVLKQTIYR